MVTNSLGSGLCSGRAVPVVTVTEAPVRGLSCKQGTEDSADVVQIGTDADVTTYLELRNSSPLLVAMMTSPV